MPLVSFFDEPALDAAEFEEPVPHRMPWGGTSDDTAGVVVPMVRVLARTDEVAIIVSGFVAYPAGFDLTIVTIARLASAKPGIAPHPLGYHSPDSGFPSDAFLRFGLRFADGSKATNIAFGRGMGPSQPGARRLRPLGGGGGGRKYSSRFWCEPLPPAGSLGLLCEWPTYGIAETEDVISADLILAAAEQAKPIWPEDVGIPAPPSGSAATYGGSPHESAVVSVQSEGGDP
jgi:hypothetical protein